MLKSFSGLLRHKKSARINSSSAKEPSAMFLLISLIAMYVCFPLWDMVVL